MKCIYCRGKTTVIETAKIGAIVLRRRRCHDCLKIFPTEETCIVHHTDLLRKLYKIRKGELEIE